jgi:hypothetical protein
MPAQQLAFACHRCRVNDVLIRPSCVQGQQIATVTVFCTHNLDAHYIAEKKEQIQAHSKRCQRNQGAAFIIDI